MAIEIDTPAVLFDQEVNNQLDVPINEGYLTIPHCMYPHLDDYFDRPMDTTPLGVESSNFTWAEYALKDVPVDERYPDLIKELYLSGIPFFYQYEFIDGVVTTIYFIPGKNEGKLTIMPHDLFNKKRREWNKLMKCKIDDNVLNNHMSRLLARLNLVGDWQYLPRNWNQE